MQEALQDEKEKVDLFLQRLEGFLRLEFSEQDAELLALSDAPMADARNLLSRGCSHVLALRILL